MFNSQRSILIRRRRVILRIGPIVRSYLTSVQHLAIRHPLRMRIEHWELSIGQIPGRIQGSGFRQVIFARALSNARRAALPNGSSDAKFATVGAVYDRPYFVESREN